MRLTVEENRAALKRYGHIKPAGGGQASQCRRVCPGTSRACTLKRGHSGPHIAHGLFRRVTAVWDSGPETMPAARSERAQPSPRAKARPRKAKPIGLRASQKGSLISRIGRGVVALFSQWDQLVFVVLFIVFIKLAFDVLLTL